jgi:multidrug resistance efflux pump
LSKILENKVTLPLDLFNNHQYFGSIYIYHSTLGLEIYSQVSSAIIEIKPAKTQVKKGDVIVRLDDRQAKLELQYLKTLQSIKQQDFDDKKLELQQTKELYERLVSSHRDLEIAQLAFDATKRELDAHNLKIKIAQIELEKYTITSPISGIIKNLPNQRNVVNINTPKILMIIE